MTNFLPRAGKETAHTDDSRCMRCATFNLECSFQNAASNTVRHIKSSSQLDLTLNYWTATRTSQEVND
jgi:hypothetical protein